VIFPRFYCWASAAARYRCLCTGWEYSYDDRCFVSHYYQNRTIPRGPVPSSNDTLIDISNFDKFIKKTYKSYRVHTHRDFLDNAIAILTSEKATLEDQYTRLFAALQSIFWAGYKHFGGSEKNVKIRRLYDIFCDHYQLNLDDLWPLFDHNSKSALVDLRNYVAHGEPVLQSKVMSLSKATENLQWTVERTLLCVLGWPITKSKVAPRSLALWSAHNWKMARNAWTA